MKTKQQKLKLTLFLILAASFNLLFWKEFVGINYLLYSTIFLSGLIAQHPERLKHTATLSSFSALLISLFSVIWVNSVLSIIMYLISSTLFVSFYYQSKIKSIYYALPASILNLFYSTLNIKGELSELTPKTNSRRSYRKWIKLLVGPILVAVVFGIIYMESNPLIEQYTVLAWDSITSYLSEFFTNDTLFRMAFIIVGVMLSGFFIYYKQGKLFSYIDEKQGDVIVRKNKRKSRTFTLNALLDENRSAIATLLFLNVLVFLVNVVDVWKVWISFDYDQGATLSSELHKGIYLLILSIVLSIAVLAYFFRGNLNFLKQNKPLKILGYVWLGQNILLAITAFIKCLYYINYYSFTYKRIGVLVFLLATMFGLGMMFMKLHKQKSVYFLLRANTWFIYLFLVGATLVNWDNVIAQYNLKIVTFTEPDYRYLMSLSEKTFPVLLENEAFMEMHKEKSLSQFYGNYWTFPNIDHKIDKYLMIQEQLSFLSWNRSSHVLTNYFKNHQLK
ncbi:MAG: hypothetical protein ACJAZ2_000729 [Glaciecola sp.]|jgi:hypothetical protein